MSEIEVTPEPRCCYNCGRPLMLVKWTKAYSILLCNDSKCKAFRQPQGGVPVSQEIPEDVNQDVNPIKKLRGKKTKKFQKIQH